MAFVLSPLPTTPLESPFGSSLHMQSCSSIADDATVRRYNGRSPSPASFDTSPSQLGGYFAGRKENSPIVSGSGSTPSLVNLRLLDSSRLNTTSSPRRSWSWNVPGDHLEISSYDLISRFQIHIGDTDAVEVQAIDGHISCSEPTPKAKVDCETRLTPETAQTLFLEDVSESQDSDEVTFIFRAQENVSFDDGEDFHHRRDKTQSSPFKRWLRTLKRSHVRDLGVAHLSNLQRKADIDSIANTMQLKPPSSRHEKTASSIASTTLITAVKTASITMTSLSLYPRSRRSIQINYLQREDSQRDQMGRQSFDSIGAPAAILMDDGTCFRSLQRHRIVEELVSSEESYIRDLKTLLSVYLAVLPRNSHDRKTIQRTASQMLLLHEELINQLQGTLWDDDCHLAEKSFHPKRLISRHTRWHSMETSPPKSTIRLRKDRFNRHSIDTSQPSLIRQRPFMADTQLVLEVARIFDKFISRFLLYEAYAAYNDLMGECSAALKESILWSETEKGIEALSSLTISIENRETDRNKALAFSDLLVKPIQRICKYPLFFRDLCKYTPACDDPVAHADLQKVLIRLEETAEEINLAMCNIEVRKRVEISWLLQNRFQFEDNALDGSSFSRKLGHVLLCGVLHVAYPTSNGVNGQYLACALYRSTLILAAVGKTSHLYRVILCVPIVNICLDEADNGKGLQCHTAQFTWKLVFDVDRRQYEIIMSACSEMEEEAWRRNLRARITTENEYQREGRQALAIPIFVNSEFRPTGPSFAPILNFSRRLSIQRAATLGSKSLVQQVIIKNTEARRYSNSSYNGNISMATGLTNASLSSSNTVLRSQSHNSAVNLPTLAPRRSERVKLENTLADVWTRFEIPYPGMGGKAKGESSIRASASSVMRKLSMASIASNFSKRSVSQATFTAVTSSATNVIAESGTDVRNTSSILQPPMSKHTRKVQKQRKESSPPVLVDFHNAPDAFLPEDFEVAIPKSNHRALKLSERLSTTVSFITSVTATAEHRKSCSVVTGPRFNSSVLKEPSPCNTISETIRAVRTFDAEVDKTRLMPNPSLVIVRDEKQSTDSLPSNFASLNTKHSKPSEMTQHIEGIQESKSKSNVSGSDGGAVSKSPLKRFTKTRRAFFGLFG